MVVVAETFVDPSLGLVMRNSLEFPTLYISKCGCWLFNSGRKNYYKRYMRNKQYKYLKCCGAKYYLHRICAFAWVYNPCPGVFNTVDHIDHDTQNNKAENLRWVTVQLNCIHRKTKGFEKIVKKNGAVFYRSRTCIGGKNTSKYYRTRDAAICGVKSTRDDNFARIYKTHLDEGSRKKTDLPVYRRASHHVLWTDTILETPEGFKSPDTRTRGGSPDRAPKFTVYNL